MKAIQIKDGKLVWADADAGSAVGVGEVRIRVAATAINRADLVQRTGGYPPPPGASPILGLECAGEVLEVGEGVSRVAAGDAVMLARDWMKLSVEVPINSSDARLANSQMLRFAYSILLFGSVRINPSSRH